MKALGKLLAGIGKWLLGAVLVVVGMVLAAGKWLLGAVLVVVGMVLAASKWLIFIAALGALVAGGWLLFMVWQGQPVAAAFTRVGGDTHVETALEASRFWTKPRRVVTVWPDAGRQTMLRAAQCAMARDAPLLFRSHDPKRERMVEAMITSWGLDPNGHDVILVRAHTRCLPGNAPDYVKGLTAYDLPILPLPRPHVALASGELAPFVVFAAAWAPKFPPDIAVGLALAAHMARMDGGVSLVVVPRYLEANAELVAKLGQQHRLVKGGVILGDPNNLSEDTRALLRQLLTSTDEQAVLGEIRTNLGLVAPLLAALAALFALGMEPKIGRKIAGLGGKIWPAENIYEYTTKVGSSMFSRKNQDSGEPAGGTETSALSSSPKGDWLQTLGEDRDVTVWLRDGPNFTGTVDNDHTSKTVLRLLDVDLTKLERTASGPELDRNADVLVPFEEIQWVIVNVPASRAPEGKATDVVAT